MAWFDHVWETDTIDSPTPGSDIETDAFSSHDDLTETGGGHSNVSLTYNSDDGARNTVQFAETNTEGDLIDESLHSVDGGEEDISVANNLETSHTRDETDTETGGTITNTGVTAGLPELLFVRKTGDPGRGGRMIGDRPTTDSTA